MFSVTADRSQTSDPKRDDKPQASSLSPADKLEFEQAYQAFRQAHAEQFRAVARIEKFLTRRFGEACTKVNPISAPTLSPAEATSLVIQLEALPKDAPQATVIEILRLYLERHPDRIREKISENRKARQLAEQRAAEERWQRQHEKWQRKKEKLDW